MESEILQSVDHNYVSEGNQTRKEPTKNAASQQRLSTVKHLISIIQIADKEGVGTASTIAAVENISSQTKQTSMTRQERRGAAAGPETTRGCSHNYTHWTDVLSVCCV